MATWTGTNKSSAPTYTSTDKSDAGVSETNLLIGGGFRMLIGGGYFLTIQPASAASTTWTPVTKN